MSSRDPITPVLAEDGARADGGDYFLCLPANAKFVASAWNQWGTHNSDGGTAWITQESLDRDETDRGGRVGVGERGQAADGKPVSSFTLLPEEELQMLLDVPSELVQGLGQSRVTVQRLQNATRDRREEARQSRRLLERSHRALEKDSGFLSKQQESRADLGTTGTRLTRALETAPPKLPLQARSSWR
ncbi:hypothetical protein JEQ12_006664 [Ovis aries]|uniref:CIDE-N domain-containing protein n=1 Tax=Ovis aries TaxID=9940 RepID=A0A836CV90_SHEEP|nr:hypothetical protein JEQ12_006664 [Ovis aries]